MQIIATAEQMQKVDRIAIRNYGIPGLVLMENAGRAFVDQLQLSVGSLENLTIVILCGKGNNGGDGFVIARHAVNRGARVFVYLLGSEKDVRGDARTNLKAVLRLAADQQPSIHFERISSLRSLSRHRKPDIVVDAILGTGFLGPVKGLYRKAIEWINGSGARVVSVDIPSGVDATNGSVGSLAVSADATVTMGLGKIGLYVAQGREQAGEVSVADIGVPSGVMKPAGDQVFRVEIRDVAESIPDRPLQSHKYTVGKIFVLAGSRNYTGAPFLCAQAALRTGAGAVVLGVPKSIHLLLARKLTEVMVHSLDENPDGSVSPECLETVLGQCAWSDVVIVGPGLSKNQKTTALLSTLIPRIEKPLVLDADGLLPLAKSPTLVRKRDFPTILTPHAGELSRMFAKDAAWIEKERVSASRKAAAHFACTVVLKGSPTATALPGGEVYLNTTGNPGMATAGSGDVLSGIIGGLLGQGVLSSSAGYAGAFLHGLAGDLAEHRFGQRGMLALDICEQIPEALKRING